MAVNEILFKALPFRPARNQVFYIENGYDVEVNNFICSHYLHLKSMFSRIGMDFYYLPYLLNEHDIEAKVRYYAPYLSPKILVQKVKSNAFVQFLCDPDTRASLKPSFIFDGQCDDDTGDVRFLSATFESLLNSNNHIIDQLKETVLSSGVGAWLQQTEEFIPSPCLSDAITFSEEDDGYETEKSRGAERGLLTRIFNAFNNKTTVKDSILSERADAKNEEDHSLIETAKVLRELRMTVQRLRLEGVSLMAIHEFIDKQEPLSRMIITPDYRILLPEYHHIEIEMGALPKAIYFLYLRYPEGILYKHMQDYFCELLNIYKQLRPNTDEARLNLTITKVVNPLGNALNENIARIRKAFVEKFDEHLANNYIVTGERGSLYSIPLDRELIIWEE